MADFFKQKNQHKPEPSPLNQKRSSFRNQIRNNDISQKIKQLRVVGTDGPHIKSLINALPASWHDFVDFMINHQPYHEAITKNIIAKVYPIQFSENCSAQNLNTYLLLPLYPASSICQFQKQIYLFSILLQHQSIYAPDILKKYFFILLDQAKHFNRLELIFCILNQVVKKSHLNWIPTEQIKKAISSIEQRKDQGQKPIYHEEVEMYVYLTGNYFQKTKQQPQIRKKIKSILQMGSECFQYLKPKIFFKLCLNITYFQSPQQQDNISKVKQNKNDISSYYHSALIKGRIVNNIYRIIFYCKKQNLRHVCLQILRNLMLQYGSLFIWNDLKLCPIQRLGQQIKDDSNSYFFFRAISDIFLISILQLPKQQLHKLDQNEVNYLDIILYILQNIEKNKGLEFQIHQHAQQCLWYIFQEGNNSMKLNVANRLLQSRWKQVLGLSSDLLLQCQQFMNISS